jgi:hypothetical protein
MKTVVIVLIILISACSKLSSDEQLFVGKWSWNYEQEGVGESGFLKLTNKGKYSYLIESWSPTERLSESSLDELHGWLFKDGSICLSRESKNFNICQWSYNVSANGEPELFFKGNLLQGNIKASRSEI